MKHETLTWLIGVYGQVAASDLFRHKHGGVYRFIEIGMQPDDDTQYAVYEHLYPFEDECKCAFIRPLHEWTPDRFAPLTYQGLSDIIVGQSREALKSQILEAKANATK